MVTSSPALLPRESAVPGRVRSVVLLGAITALPALAIDAYLPALPALTRDLETTPAATQLTLTAVLLGMALGQLITGPLSDRWGRRLPLNVGLGVFVVASALCAVAPNVEALVALRLLMGLGGGAAVVVARAVVRDQATGATAARVFARLMLVVGVAPVLAPIAGTQLLRFGSWRGVFAGLVLIGLALLAVTARRLRETLPAQRRTRRGAGGTLRTFARLLRDRPFLGYGLASALSFAALFAYVSASPFVLQQVYGMSPAMFSAVFALNAVGLIGASQVSARLVPRTGPHRLLAAGLGIGAAGGLALVALALTGAPLPLLLAALFAVLSSIGLVGPNATALALEDHGAEAGTAAALLGLLQFAAGAVAAPLSGLFGAGSVLPFTVVVAAFALTAAAAGRLVRHG